MQAATKLSRRMTHRRVSGDNVFHDNVLMTIFGRDIRGTGMEKGNVDRKCHLIGDACVSSIDGSSSREAQASLSFLRARSIREASCYLVFAA